MSHRPTTEHVHRDGPGEAPARAYRTSDQSAPPRHPHDHHRRRPERSGPSRPAGDPRRAYTLAHAGRQVRLGPVAFWTVVGSLVVMAGWSVTTASYFAFKDDVIVRMIARQAEIEAAYEDRLAEMRSQVDRVTTRQLLDQEQFDQKLDHVVRRQGVLEGRAAALGTLADPVTTGSVRPSGRPALPPDGPAATPKPSRINDTVIHRAPPDRNARLESRTPAGAVALAGRPGAAATDGKLARIVAALDRIEMRQAATLTTMEESLDGKARRLRAVLADLGLEKAHVQEAGVGGPFVPVRLASNAQAFDRQLHRIRLARAQVDRLTRVLAHVPVRRPMDDIDFSSTFGVRTDPFLGRPALHAGLDFRGDVGDPIRATANGTVESAGWNGGYGKMVEIDHGNGLTTRFAHLSDILVKAGQSVRAGQIIGRMGSTGRSTGPHLHYETRVDGDAVDPQKFLRAGLRLGAL